MSRKRLSQRRENELASLDEDLPFIKFRPSSATAENALVEAASTSKNVDNTGTSLGSVSEVYLNMVNVANAASITECERNSDIKESDTISTIFENVNNSDSTNEISCSASSEEDFTELEQITLKKTLREQLRELVVEENLTLTSVNKLLRVLHPFHPELPLDARTLLQTRISTMIRQMDDGRYCHLGLKNGILAMKTQLSNFKGPLQLLFNVDGLPITKGGEKNFWPILCQITNVQNSVFPVGIYEGKTKPKCFNSFLSEFVEEVLNLVENGMIIDGTPYIIQVKGFIMDAPATASVLYVAPFNAYYGCRKCWAKGTFEGKVVFPELNSNLRTNLEFRNQNCPNHHNGKSELEKLNINMVDDIPLDPMHLVYLGVMKKLIGLWVERKRGNSEKLSLSSIALLNSKMIEYARFYPQEFQRKPRRIDHYKMWKATEFRDFLLYTGPIALKDILSASTFKHFMAFSTAIRILSHPDYLKYNRAANDLLIYFVRNFSKLYGITHLTYNVHGLLHLASDCANFGQLEQFSAFKFESYLGKLKRKLRTAYLPLPQICNRIAEMRSLNSLEKKVSQKEFVLSKPIKNTNQFAEALFSAYY